MWRVLPSFYRVSKRNAFLFREWRRFPRVDQSGKRTAASRDRKKTRLHFGLASFFFLPYFRFFFHFSFSIYFVSPRTSRRQSKLFFFLFSFFFFYRTESELICFQSTSCDPILLGLLGFTGLGLIRLNSLQPGLIEFAWFHFQFKIRLDCTGFSWVFLGFSWFYWVLLGFS